MNYSYITDGLSLLQALLAGIAMGLYYDVFRLLRRFFRFGWMSVVWQDLFFWVTSAVALYFRCVACNEGYLRLYFVIIAVLGWGVYDFTAGRLLFVLIDRMARHYNRISDTFRHRVMKKMIEICIKILHKK